MRVYSISKSVKPVSPRVRVASSPPPCPERAPPLRRQHRYTRLPCCSSCCSRSQASISPPCSRRAGGASSLRQMGRIAFLSAEEQNSGCTRLRCAGHSSRRNETTPLNALTLTDNPHRDRPAFSTLHHLERRLRTRRLACLRMGSTETCGASACRSGSDDWEGVVATDGRGRRSRRRKGDAVCAD